MTIDTPLPEPTWRFRDEQTNAPLDVAIEPRLTLTTPEAAAQAAVLGIGVVRLLHYQAAESIERTELQIVLPRFEPEPAPVHLVHVFRGQMPLKMRRFLDFVKPELRAKLQHIAMQ